MPVIPWARVYNEEEELAGKVPIQCFNYHFYSTLSYMALLFLSIELYLLVINLIPC